MNQTSYDGKKNYYKTQNFNIQEKLELGGAPPNPPAPRPKPGLPPEPPYTICRTRKR